MYYKLKLMATHNFKVMIITCMSSRHGTIHTHFILPQIYVSKFFQKLMQPLIQNIEVFILLVINQLSIYSGTFGTQKYFFFKNTGQKLSCEHNTYSPVHGILSFVHKYIISWEWQEIMSCADDNSVHKIISCAPKILCYAK